MDFKLFLLVFHLFFIGYLVFKWYKKGFALKGNETIIILSLLFIALLLPGDEVKAIIRLLILFVPLLFYDFNKSISNGKINNLFYVPVCLLLGQFLFIELLMIFINVKILIFAVLQFVVLYLSGVIFFYMIYKNWKVEDKPNDLISLWSLYDSILYSLCFLLVSSAIITLCVVFNCDKAAVKIFMCFIMLLGVLYVFIKKPDCMLGKDIRNTKHLAYITGRRLKNGEMLEDEKYGIINIGVVDDATIIYNIIKLFETEKVFLRSDVKISEIAKKIGTNKVYLSRALGTRLSKNFCQFVNYYRVKEVCTLFINNPKIDIRVIGEKCGFNSQSNFSIVFKYNTGFTPMDWSRMVKQKIKDNESVSVGDYIY